MFYHRLHYGSNRRPHVPANQYCYRVPNAGIMYSKDRGETWKIHNYARTNTTEAQVAEVEPGNWAV